MFNLTKKLNKCVVFNAQKQFIKFQTNTTTTTQASDSDKYGEFKVLNLRSVRGQITRRPPRKYEIISPRCDQMPVDQDWGNVWPGPRTFHPATVPLPIRQGHRKKGVAPDKYGNAELMKIPNFLHLTPPVIKRQCEALKKFCTPWPKNLSTDEQCQNHFPIEVYSSDYCHSAPTIRDPLSRIITIKLKLSKLNLNQRAKDKFFRLVGDRYDEKNDLLTLVVDRCPTRKQNYDYGMYLITALYHESNNVEAWENLKCEADMEVYIWENNESKKSVEKLFNKSSEEIPDIKLYSEAVEKYMNEGESDYTIGNYAEIVRKMLNLPVLRS